jgi:hypothetical protein
MATLGKPRWYTKPRPHTKLDGTPFGHIFKRLRMPEFGEREGEIGPRPNKKDNPFGALEWEEWKAINDLDARGKSLSADDWVTYVQQVSDVVEGKS